MRYAFPNSDRGPRTDCSSFTQPPIYAHAARVLAAHGPLPDGLVKASILDDPAEVAMPVGHRLADRAEVDLAEFAEDEWITWGEGEFCHEWLMFTLRSKGVEPHVGHRAAETHTQLSMVAAGLGVCIAPVLGRRPMAEGVVTVPLRQRVRRHVYVVWRADADRRPSIRAAVEALRAAGEGVH